METIKYTHHSTDINPNYINILMHGGASALHTIMDIATGIDSFIPSKLCKTKNSFPWINKDLTKLMHKRDKLYKKDRTSRKFKHFKKTVQQKIRSAHEKYLETIIIPEPDANSQGLTKKFWSYIKHCKSNKNDISPLKERGILYSDSVKKAEILNDQFTSVFSKDDLSQPHPLPNPEFPTIEDIYITEPGVLKLLQNLKPNKASGPDNISPMVLKTLAPEIAPSLTLIFQKTYDSSEVPKHWRTANVTPIFKKGEKYIASNYSFPHMYLFKAHGAYHHLPYNETLKGKQYSL